MRYEETQYGTYVNLVIILLLVFILLSYVFKWGNNPLPQTIFFFMEGLFVFIYSMFYKMTTVIENREIKIAYGIGMIRIRIRPEKIINVEKFKVPWYWGMGIRITPKGLLYSINGFQTVIIKYIIKGKERTTLIGTQDPDDLKSAIERHFLSEINIH